MRVLAVALGMGCGDKAGDSGGEPEATFTAVQEDVLLPSCAFSSCHGSGTGGLTLGGDGDHDALVGAESAGAPGEILVVPGDPDASYLVRKMEGAAGIVGDPMPPTGALDAARIEQVRAWIEAGAPND